MSELFDQFSPVSSKAWKQKIQADLKGADYNSTLLWHTNEGITIKPFYHGDDDITMLDIPKSKPWKITEHIEVTAASKAIQQAKDAIAAGAEAILFQVADLEALPALHSFSQSVNIPIHCINLSDTYSTANEQNCVMHQDIITHLARSGNWYQDLQTDHQLFETTVQQTGALSINATIYQNAGAHCVQQVAYALAHATEYFNHFKDATINSITYINAVGANYFFEIAKIRALKYLHKRVAEAFQMNEDCEVISIPTKRNKSIYDYNSNLLRSTTECMSAILGGSDYVCNLPYDATYQSTNEFGNRIARNQLLIMRDESYFNAENEASRGAYYIEQLTHEIAEKALEIFQSIEKGGGFLKQLKEGTIQRKIDESAAAEQQQFDAQDKVLVGVNKYENEDDKMKDNLEKDPFLAYKKRKTLIAPIIARRLAEKLEKERLKNE